MWMPVNSLDRRVILSPSNLRKEERKLHFWHSGFLPQDAIRTFRQDFYRCSTCALSKPEVGTARLLKQDITKLSGH